MLALVVLGAFHEARAADPRAQARALMQEGGELLAAGRHQRALEKFQAAYDLVPSPNIVYNLGLCHEGMGHAAEAFEAFSRFLAEAKDAPPVNVKRAETFIQRLRPRVAVLQLGGDLEGADIVVDGRARGKGPLPYDIALTPGAHRLSAEKAGRRPFSTNLDVVAGERVKVSIAFEAPETERRAAPVAVTAAVSAQDEAAVAAVAATPAPAAGWIRTGKWVATGVAAAALSAGVFLRLTAYDAFNDHRGAPLTVTGECSTASGVPDSGGGRCAELLRSGDRRSGFGTAALIAGGAAAAGAAVLFFMDGPSSMDDPSPRQGAAVRCVATLAAPGAACSLVF